MNVSLYLCGPLAASYRVICSQYSQCISVSTSLFPIQYN